MDRYIVKKSDIESDEGLFKQHFLNTDAQRTNKSLGDLTGIAGFGFHLLEVMPGKESTEYLEPGRYRANLRAFRG